MTVSVTVCDTRRGDGLSKVIADAPTLEARIDEPFVVVDAVSVDWLPYAATLDDVLRTGAAHPFTIVNPWWPGIDGKIAAIGAALPGATQVGPVLLASCPPRPLVAEVLRLRESIGGHASGTWIIGTCESLEALVERLRVRTAPMTPVFAAALDVFDCLNGALCLDELRMSTLVVRVTPENAAAVDRLLERVAPG